MVKFVAYVCIYVCEMYFLSCEIFNVQCSYQNAADVFSAQWISKVSTNAT